MKKRFVKILALTLSMIMIFDIATPTLCFALTGGPSQPEVQSFEPVGTSEMVDVFSGDFNYNIPLLDVGGYPINISYHGGVGMDQESSWVGLGWNINPGVINRNMRGIPDDFDGDLVKKEFNIKSNNTFGVTAKPKGEALGINFLDKIGFGLGLSYNNYKGVGFEVSINPAITASESNKSPMTAHLGISAGSESGVGITPTVSFSKKIQETEGNPTKASCQIGLPFNSREGLKALTFSAGVNKSTPTKINKDRSRGYNASSDISFASQTYVPQIDMPMINTSLGFGIDFGVSAFGVDGMLGLEGYYSGQFLLKNDESLPAYGYLYSQKAKGEKQMMDFNREKDGSFSENTANLPVTNFSYDIYSVSGQGIGGMYRPFRSDVGVVYDSKVTNLGGGVSVSGIEAAGGNITHAGIDVTVNFNSATSGRWDKDNSTASVLKFRETNAGSLNYEPSYFKQAGEKTAETDTNFFKQTGAYDAVRVELSNTNSAMKTFIGAHDRPINIAEATSARKIRQRRDENISYLNASEANDYGLDKNINYYNEFSMDGAGNYIPTRRLVRNTHPAHHISEITALRADGARYVYGIPAYNLTQDEVTFAVMGDPNCATGLVNYATGSDNSTGNSKGADHYFNKVSLPEYAHSYLLTAILSPDYVDISGDGPSDDDMGTYTKINYTKLEVPYRWRVPFQKDSANYSEGLKSANGKKDSDDKGNYIYGTKEVWYVHSIVSRTQVAEFTMDNRDDSYGVTDANGGLDRSQALKKLVAITLYSKPDRAHNSKPVPIKTVHFEYDYSLCPHIPNNIKAVDPSVNTDASGFPNQGGKLTLKKIYFTYGNSKKGKLSPYTFNYADVDHDGTMDVNYPYNLKGYDRWGNYKPNPGDANTSHLSPITTGEFPYVDQDTTLVNKYAAAWSLTSIDLPSGGTIKVDYESDDYAYVQNRRAMQMFKITGIGHSYDDSPVGHKALMEPSRFPGDIVTNNYLFFKLQDPISDISNAKKFLKDNYIGNIDSSTLYFRFLMKVNRKNTAERFEYVPGYAQIEEYNICPPQNGSATHGYVKLKAVTVDKKGIGNVNPISKTAWQFTRLNLPRVAYGQSDVNANGLKQIMQALSATVGSITELLQGGINWTVMNEDLGKECVFGKSWIRLYNPNERKLGGGHRVKKIVISDEWNRMAGNQTSDYGQVYDYTTKEESGRIISSGVAAYEPILGGDENPFRKPVFFSYDRLLAPSDDFYQEEPFGESFFPGASVGYSKVTVRNLQYNDVKKNATGSVVHEFYTAKDYPTLTRQTALKTKHEKTNPLFKLLKIKNKDYMTASQGYVIELNDMHGKQKAQWVYPEGSDKYISGVQYFYKDKQVSETINAGGKQKIVKYTVLDNEIDAIEKSGIRLINKRTIGMDYDMVVDMRQHESLAIGGGGNFNLDGFVLGIIPVVIPMLLVSMSNEQIRFRSATTTKVINRYGLVDKVVAYDLGASVSTKNLLYDAQTGEVLLTETTNQFNDPLYSFTFPAHWGYDRMGPASQNIGAKLTNVLLTDIPNAKSIFVPGDELSMKYLSQATKGWVTEVGENSINVIDKDGNVVSAGPYELKVIRSGRRNQQSASIGSITCLNNPLQDTDGDGYFDNLSFTGVLNSNAVEYSEKWKVFCNCGVDPDKTYNPYVFGASGNWRAKRSYLYLTDRKQSTLNNNTDIRKDGVFKTFDSFWNKPVDLNQDWVSHPDNWTFTVQVTEFSPYGFELENKDALNRFSSALFGYNHIIPIAVSNNSKYKETAFDGVEDYDFGNCTEDHFSFKNSSSQRTTNQSHTGRNSLRVTPGNSLQLEKIINPCNE